MFLWDSRADTHHYVEQEWPARQGLEPGSHTVLPHPLVDPIKVLLPPLHIKLRLMKINLKAKDSDGSDFLFPCEKFKRKSIEKLKADILDSPEIRELMKNASFDESLNPTVLST